MKITILLIVLPIAVFAQPSGRLYIHAYNFNPGAHGSLGYIDYPAAIYNHADSTDATDFIIVNDSLYLANNDVIVYSTNSNSRIDSFQISDATMLASWNDQLIVLSQTAPYYRVFDRFSHNQIYSIDGTKIGMQPSDILVSNNRAYVLLSDSVVVVDLFAHDTLAKISTPHPFPFGGSNSHIVERNGIAYIDVNYATGAARFSVVTIDETTLSFDTLFHYEGAESFIKPVIANDSICLYMFPSHYNITTDSLFITNGNYAALTYDSASHSVFVRPLSGNNISYFNLGIYSNPVTVPNPVNKVVFINSPVSAITEHELNSINIYPNPASDLLKIDGEDIIDRIEITDINGKLIKEKYIHAKSCSLILTDLPAATYYIKIYGEKTIVKSFTKK